jgi:sarcosine oxidase/L-pipecolate oxidase
VGNSLRNVQDIGTDRISVLHSPTEIQKTCGLEANNSIAENGPGAPGGGSIGYVNWSSGWADAEGAMRWLYQEVASYNRVRFVTGTITRLLISHHTSTVSGALLSDGAKLTADLTVLAAGAWSPSLLDMRGTCKATGQPLVYLTLTPEEQEKLASVPTILNLSTGMFAITPSNNMIKIARHGHGYTNPVTIPHPEIPGETITVSLPYTHIDAQSGSQSQRQKEKHSQKKHVVPLEARRACEDFLRSTHPSLWEKLKERKWARERICWYADTPTHDFIVDWHPRYQGLFVATGGSGHGFKFLPVMGECVIERMFGVQDKPSTEEEKGSGLGGFSGEKGESEGKESWSWTRDFKDKWAWPRRRWDEGEWEGDGSRGGEKGMVLFEELGKERVGESKL